MRTQNKLQNDLLTTETQTELTGINEPFEHALITVQDKQYPQVHSNTANSISARPSVA
jgi:hypothetical protein